MPADPIIKWEEFLSSHYWDELLELADSYPDERSLMIKFPDLDRYDPEFAEELLENPEQLLEAAKAALLEIDLPMDVYLDRAHVRITELPMYYKTCELRSNHIGKLVAIEGLVRTATEVRPKIISAAFQCQRCGYTFFKEQTGIKFEDQNLKCQNQACDRGGPFKLVLSKSKFVDAQKIRVQESPEDLRGREQPRTLDVELEDDLAGRIFPGDRVIINGILKSYQRSIPQSGKSTYFGLFHKGISVEMKEQEFEEIEISPEEEMIILKMSKDPEIYNKIKGSIAPSIFGYDNVKEALALQLVSGVTKDFPDKTRVRGDIHILLVGDPGTAKSQLLKYVINIAPRGIYTTGKGTTTAGLTATMVRDDLSDDRWSIEGGALVLADMGIVALDGLNEMSSEDKNALHESMEQQTVSIAKAGVVATLKSRCSLLAAANPKYGKFDSYEPIAPQINLTPPLISMFDLIFIMQDEPSKDQDYKLATYVLKRNTVGVKLAGLPVRPDIGIDDIDKDDLKNITPSIEPELLRKYIDYAKKKIFPIPTDGAQDLLREYYINARASGKGSDEYGMMTVRKLEALTRLAEARARLRLSQEITSEDVREILRIVDSCQKNANVDPERGSMDADIIATGTTRGTRDKTKMMMDIIRDISKECQGSAPKDAVLDRAEQLGIEQAKAVKIIDLMKRDGDIFESRPGMLKAS